MDLAEVGRPEEGLIAIREAIAVRRTLAGAYPALSQQVSNSPCRSRPCPRILRRRASAPQTGTDDAPKKRAGIPPEPNAVEREVILRALNAVNPAITADEDKAISNARNQCSTISGGGNATETAKQRFSTSEHQVTDAEAITINAALKGTLCP
ncbi:hypothetical protein ACGFMM_15440 [Streptomyces sp. NPDC048604]|uniref:hypothetical protein n=1 Tax=Streptomyces sp. NPDC048604 TaxID=3365578 RepID=UPI003721D3BD